MYSGTTLLRTAPLLTQKQTSTSSFRAALTMKKRKTLCTAGVAALCAVPSIALPSQAMTKQEISIMVARALGYCAWQEGGWTKDRATRWVVKTIMSDMSMSDYDIYGDRVSATNVIDYIDREGGCTQLMSDSGSRRTRTTTTPASDVLSDTPFRF